jgi:hypothetical protein
MESAYLTLSTENLKIDLSGPANYIYNLILYNPTRDLVAFKVIESGGSYLNINPIYGQIMPKEETILAITCNRTSIRTLSSKFIIHSFPLHDENLKKAMKLDNPWDHRVILGIQNHVVDVVYSFNFNTDEDGSQGFSIAKTDLEDKKEIQKQIDSIDQNRQKYAQLARKHEDLEIETFLQSQKLNEKTSELARDEAELITLEEEAKKFTDAIHKYQMLLDIYEGETHAISKLKTEAIMQTEARLFTSILALEPLLKSKKSNEMAEISCTYCFENPIDVIIYPCKHVCTCHMCIGKLINCPICRCKIVKSERVFIQTSI